MIYLLFVFGTWWTQTKGSDESEQINGSELASYYKTLEFKTVKLILLGVQAQSYKTDCAAQTLGLETWNLVRW